MNKPSPIGKLLIITITVLLITSQSIQADEFPLLTSSCESALALSAAPENISRSATIYVLTKNGYEIARVGQNDYSCIVARNHPKSLLPICYDKEGTESILETIIGTSELVLKGATDTEIDSAIMSGFKSGSFRHPRTTSLSFMLSKFNYGYRESTQRMVNMWPHTMISTEHTRESIEFDPDIYEYHNMPTISPMGPYRFFIIVSPEPTDSSEIVTQCEGQFDFLPE